MLVDESGRKLKVGQQVKVVMNGSFGGYVTEIYESVIEVPGQGPIPPRVRLMIGMEIPATRISATDGIIPNVFIVGDPNPKVNVEDQNGGRTDDPGLIPPQRGKKKVENISDHKPASPFEV